jgi:tetratricopeptide (TPR) repeat protein
MCRRDRRKKPANENRRRTIKKRGPSESEKVPFHKALESYEKALAQINRDDEPVIWAATLVDAGKAHSQLGIGVEGEAAHEHLNAAVICHQDALRVFIRERFPQDWAATQNNLGAALQAQALRTAGDDAAKLLAQAVDAYCDALQIFSKRDFASFHDMISRNLKDAVIAGLIIR